MADLEPLPDSWQVIAPTLPAETQAVVRGLGAFGDDAVTNLVARAARLAIEESTRDLRAEVQAHEAVRDACFEALPECQVWGDVPGHIAELRAEKDGAYLERNHLVAALSKLYPSGLRITNIPGWSADWHGCCMIDLPTGQISYHFHDSQAHLFAHLKPYAGEWDGHDKDVVHARLGQLEESAQVRDLRERLERAQGALLDYAKASSVLGGMSNHVPSAETWSRIKPLADRIQIELARHALAIREAKESAHD